MAELDAEKAALRDIPLGPNYLKDTRYFRTLALDAGGTEQWNTWTNLSAAQAPWSFVDYTRGQGTISRARVRKVNSESLRANPSTWPELANHLTLLAAQSGSYSAPGYTDYAIADFDVEMSTAVTGSYFMAYMRQGCERQGGAYTTNHRTSTQSFVKVHQLPTNAVISVAANGWPSQAFTAASADWQYVNVSAETHGGCIDLYQLSCTGPCTGTVRFAVALPCISTGRRVGFAWAGYAGYHTNDTP